MRKIIQTTYRLLLVSALLLALALPCHAMIRPTVSEVASMEEFLARYHAEDARDRARSYRATQPLVCIGTTVLDITKGSVELATEVGLQVQAGATLTLDNPNLLVMGYPPVITVEPGGTLQILRWNPMMANGTMPVEGMIKVETGGALELADGLTLPEDMVVWVESPPNTIRPPETAPPSTPEPDPEPEPEPEPEPQPITDLWGEVRRVSNGTLNYTMTLPRLAMGDVSAIAVERSADGRRWTTRETFLWDKELGYFTAGPDSYCAIQFGEKNTYIAYVDETDYQDFYLRLRLVGSRYAGVSNVVKVVIPEGAGPGESVKPPTTGDYEDNEGNQGGGGQGESDRTGQQTPTPTPSATPTPTPAPVEVPSDDHIPEEGTPDTGLPAMTQSEGTAVGLSQSTGGTGYYYVSAPRPAGSIDGGAEPAPLPAQPPVETAAPKAEETPAEEPVTATEKEAVAAAAPEPLAVQQETEAPVQTDGDRGGQAVVMTLALGGGVAAGGAIMVRMKCYKRRP